jgi:hypothetical protein
MLESGRTIATQRDLDLEWLFRQRFERYLARVYRHVARRAATPCEIEPLVERILVESIDDWMGPGEDAARAQRVLTRARSLLRGGPSSRRNASE